ncbi:MAG: patatin-like phospholipase family protein [Christensenellales bacterium]|jgi:NTE family protein
MNELVIEKTEDENKLKIGLALGAGFFRGLAHIGVLQVLEENGIEIDLIAGTSMGSVIGSIYATGMGINMLERLVYSLNERMFYDVGRSKKGFIKGEKIVSFMKTLTGDKTFDQADIPFAAVACDIETGEKLVISRGKIYEAVRASTSVPGIFVPYEVDGRVLVDGGVLERVPSSVVREMGADLVIAVDVGAREGRYEVKGTMDIILRTIELMQFSTVALGPPADMLIAPKVRHIDIMTMNDSEECIELGREAARQAIPIIKEKIAERSKEK